MPVPPNALSDETIRRMREDYRDGVAVAVILERYDVLVGTLYYWLDGGPLVEDDRRLAPIPRRREAPAKRARALRGDRKSLIARLWRTAERQVCDIETRLSSNEQASADRERDARSLAVLVRTLRELSKFDAAREQPACEDDDLGARDIDEFRRDLARRMDALVQGRAGHRLPQPSEKP